MVINITIFLINIISYWYILKKAGEKSWKILIPIYNIYIAFKIAKCVKLFWFGCIVVIFANVFNFTLKITTIDMNYDYNFKSIISFAVVVLVIIHFLYCIKLAKAFGKRVGYILGLIFFNTIFLLIIAFGNSKYEYLDQ